MKKQILMLIISIGILVIFNACSKLETVQPTATTAVITPTINILDGTEWRYETQHFLFEKKDSGFQHFVTTNVYFMFTYTLNKDILILYKYKTLNAPVPYPNDTQTFTIKVSKDSLYFNNKLRGIKI